MDAADVVVVGSGPNGLVAAAMLARKGWSVTVLERNPAPGGAVRSGEITLPGFIHDIYSAFYGILHAVPVFRELELDRRVRWAHFERPVAAAAGPGDVASIHRDPERTAEALGALAKEDADAWRDLHGWWNKVGTSIFDLLVLPVPAVRPALRVLRRAGVRGSLQAARDLVGPLSAFASVRFASDAARALIASGVTHTDLSVGEAGSVPGALILAMVSQAIGMPVPVGGSTKLTDALTQSVAEAGGKIYCGREATRIVVRKGRAVAVETPDGPVGVRRAVLADVGAPRLFLGLVGEEHFPPAFLDGLRRFRYGSGMFKVDLALEGPVPWSHPELAESGVVHLCGDLSQMARSAAEIKAGILPQTPLVIAGQATVADPSRAPAGRHTLWLENHVPPVPPGGSWDAARDEFLDRVLSRMEEHAPGFRDRILGTAVRTPADLEAENPNLVGGDVGGGSNAIDQQLVFRPVEGWFRYRTPVKGLYLCSASAHPGGGVHGMVGRNCAKRVIRDNRLRPRRRL